MDSRRALSSSVAVPRVFSCNTCNRSSAQRACARSFSAWPVAGFCGLEVLLVWGAFELNYRSGRIVEVIRLDDTQLHVRRIQPSGRSMVWTFDPGWVRVELDEAEDRNILQLAMHGRRTRLGSFLTDDERSSLADALRTALVRWRSAPDAR